MCLTKKGLSYQAKKNQKYLKNYFVKAKQSYNLNHKCNYYRAISYLIYACPIKKNKIYNMTWVKKGTISNNKRPKKIWLLKTSS